MCFITSHNRFQKNFVLNVEHLIELLCIVRDLVVKMVLSCFLSVIIKKLCKMYLPNTPTISYCEWLLVLAGLSIFYFPYLYRCQSILQMKIQNLKVMLLALLMAFKMSAQFFLVRSFKQGK